MRSPFDLDRPDVGKPGMVGRMTPSRINPIDHPICLARPELQAPSSWAEHIPFAMWLTSVLRPRVLVELGTYCGTSYCAFCQAIETLDLPTRAYAVDSWKGDPHNGMNGPEVLAGLRAYHDPRYGGFSTLLEMTFDEAATRFGDKEIDLLHVDGYHRYEVVRHDFDTWRSKVSDRGVALFHDVYERIADFGVHRLWEEMIAQYPSFTFRHEHGLGVLAIGKELPVELRTLLSIGAEDAERVRTLFQELGRRVRLEIERDAARENYQVIRQTLQRAESERLEQEFLLRKLQCDLARERRIIARLTGESGTLRDASAIRPPGEIEANELRQRIAGFEREIAELKNSFSWRLVQSLRRVLKTIAPVASRRRVALIKMGRLADLCATQGPGAVVRKVARKAGLWQIDRSAGSYTRRNWQPTGEPVFLLVSHEGGGGTERHVRELAEALKAERVRPILVRPSGSGALLWEERDESWSVTWYRRTAPERGRVKELLKLLTPVHAHIHHLMKLPNGLPDWFFDFGLTYDWTIHDYLAVCPRVHLNRADGSYCGEPDAAGCNTCLNRLGDYHGKAVTEDITAWRKRFSRYLSRARRVFAPSEDVRQRLNRYFPDLKILVRPHFEDLPERASLAASLRPGEPVRVAVLGSIVAVKGSERLMACARDARRRHLPLEFRVLGSTDRDGEFARLRNVHVSGPYRERDVFDRLTTERCHLAFLPSVWPETFMYTLSIAMAARLYTICFDLGAQAQRLRAWGWGRVLPLEAGPEQTNDAFLAAARSLVTGAVAPPPPPSAAYPELLRTYYDFTAREREQFQSVPSMPQTRAVLRPHSRRWRVHAASR
jgi:glycosyltransferase involved in cell wall biosynthesis